MSLDGFPQVLSVAPTEGREATDIALPLPARGMSAVSAPFSAVPHTEGRARPLDDGLLETSGEGSRREGENAAVRPSMLERQRRAIDDAARRRRELEAQQREEEERKARIAEALRRKAMRKVEEAGRGSSFADATAAAAARTKALREARQQDAQRQAGGKVDEVDSMTPEEQEEELARRAELKKQRAKRHKRLLRQLEAARRHRQAEEEEKARQEEKARERVRRAALGDRCVEPHSPPSRSFTSVRAVTSQRVCLNPPSDLTARRAPTHT